MAQVMLSTIGCPAIRPSCAMVLYKWHTESCLKSTNFNNCSFGGAMPDASRRDFLKLAASVGGAVIANEAKALYAESPVVAGPVRAWRTSAQEKFQPVHLPPQWETGVELSPLAIYLEPATSYQEVLGFGGAFTDASCYLLHLMERMPATHFCQISMGPPDYVYLWNGPASAQVIFRRRCTVTMTLRSPTWS